MIEVQVREGLQLPIESVQETFSELRAVKDLFAKRGWFPATSGNLSLRVQTNSDLQVFAVTASGKDKGLHTSEDFLLVDQEGRSIFPTQQKPSAETLIHTSIYRNIESCQAVFHIHTVANNLISELYREDGVVTISDQEIIKAFNIWEEGASIQVPIVPNYAHIPTLAAAVEKVLPPQVPGVLIRNHGIYVWGDSSFSAKRHLEAFEFLFEYLVQLRLLRRG